MSSYQSAVDLSPYDDLREVQKDGIKNAIEAVEDDGFLVLEGACGTGKTLLSLLPFLSYVDDPTSDYERIVAITSVKPQMEIFQEELEMINTAREEADEEKFSAVTLAGKQDVCPYVKHNGIEASSIQTTCESLRDGTRQVLSEADDKVSGADKLVETSKVGGGVRRYDTDGVFDYPFEVDDEPDTKFCPFYAGYLGSMYDAMEDGEYDPAEVVPFDVSESGVMSITDIVSESGNAGMCPHSIMGDLLETTDVVIGNYYHLFDPRTRNFSDAAIDDDTLLIVDEAHNIVPRVRDILSREIGMTTFKDGLRELRELKSVFLDDFDRDEGHWDSRSKLAGESSIFTTTQGVEKATDHFSQFKDREISDFLESDEGEAIEKLFPDKEHVSLTDVIVEYEALYTDLYEKILDFIEPEITDSEISETTDQEIPLRDADSLEMDKFTQWLQLRGGTTLLKYANSVGEQVTELFSVVHQEIYDEPITDSHFETMCNFWSDWMTLEQDRYLPMVTVGNRNYLPNANRIQKDWQEEYSVQLNLKNCLPRREIQDIVSEVGGGIFMSATLEPLEMFAKETGLSEFTDRPIIKRSYPLRYPKENRESIAVNSTKFKLSNRGKRYNYRGNYEYDGVRKEYADMILDVVESTPGNTLVVMPSYSEAEWAGDVIVDKTNLAENDVLVDSPSTMSETNELKEEFFDGGKKVLVTGAMGTLTEGIDYDGDKLKSAIVCGVPIVNTGTPFNTAIEATYDKYFDNQGFDYAFTLPAVRKTRQAIGRVIRSEDERGVRVLADERYVPSRDLWDSVHEFFPQTLTDELKELDSSRVRRTMDRFWE